MGTLRLDYGVILSAFAAVGSTVYMADADTQVIRSYKFALERPLTRLYRDSAAQWEGSYRARVVESNSELRASVVVEASRNARPDARQFQCTAGHLSYEGS